MYRMSLDRLKNWIREANRQPLVLRGARQVGKTWLVREFAKQCNLRLVEINFERAGSDVTGIFRNKDPKTVSRSLELVVGHAIAPEESLLFLDEIQAMPEVLANLRWFAEELPELPIIAAGSLLDFVLAEHAFSMPVGRISYLHVEPMTFEEFLQAAGEDELLTEVRQWLPGQVLADVAHARLSERYRDFLIVGGMPRVVQRWLDDQSLLDCAQLQQSLLGTFRDDFSKYARRMPVARIGRVMDAIPRMLGQTFKYARVADDERSAHVREALELLCRARLATRVQASTGMGIPLGGEIRERLFKVLFLDSGLACAGLGLMLPRAAKLADLILVNEGGLAEQAVGQALRAALPDFAERHLFYWTTEQKGAVAEVDYLLQHGARILPVEVKAGTTGTLKSLHHFMALRGLDLAVRVNAGRPLLADVDVRTTAGEPAQYRLLSLPFYLTGQIYRILESLETGRRS